MTTILIDANVLVRFLVKDDPRFTVQATEIFTPASQGKNILYLDEIALAETIWVMLSFYKISKTVFLPALIELVSQDWITNPRKNLMLQTLKFYQQNNFSYIDCWLYTLSQNLNFPLATFDRKLKKIKRPA